jgi:hypothetical protein
MDRSSRLADLKLVAKYYPVSNYSYPRSETPLPKHDEPSTDRTSVGSNCSVPSMVDDQGSDASADDDYQYHAQGAELWNTFWHAKGHSEMPYDGVRHSAAPAAASSGTRSRSNSQMDLGVQDRGTQSARQSRAPSVTEAWPLVPSCEAPRPETARAACSKGSYSLFPRAPLVQSRPSRTSSLAQSDTAASAFALHHASASAVNLSSLGRDRRPSALNLSAPTRQYNPDLPTPPPLSPFNPFGSSFPEEPSSRAHSPSSPLPHMTQRPSLSNLRHLTTSRMPSQHATQLPHTRLVRAKSSPRLHRDQAGFFTAYTSPPLPPLPSPPLPSWARMPSTDTLPTPPPSATLTPVSRAPSPPRISVFELDSDDEQEDDDTQSFARRFVRGFGGHKKDNSNGTNALTADAASAGHGASKVSLHKRSASDERRPVTSGTASLGRGAMRRARAETLATAVEKLWDRQDEGDRKDKDADKVKVKRQGSDVFGRMLGRRSH